MRSRLACGSRRRSPRIGGGKLSSNPGLSWHAIGTGAGGSDILLQNTSGQTTIWDMNGNTITGGGPVSPNPGPSFAGGRADVSGLGIHRNSNPILA